MIEFDPDAPDPLFVRIHEAVSTLDKGEFCDTVQITSRAAERLYGAILDKQVGSMARLSSVRGIGTKSIERLYAHFRTAGTEVVEHQAMLFDLGMR